MDKTLLLRGGGGAYPTTAGRLLGKGRGMHPHCDNGAKEEDTE